MKLAVLAVLAGLILPVTAGSVARADIINPPAGPVYVNNDADDVDPAPPPQGDRPQRGRGQRQRLGGQRMGGQRMGGQRMGGQRDPRVAANRRRLRQALLQQFDANGDGRLEARERIRAVRTLRRIEQRLAAPMQQRGAPMQQRGARDGYRRFMKRYDVNGDGVVGPREVPRGAADRLRTFDRNRDGWVEPNELP